MRLLLVEDEKDIVTSLRSGLEGAFFAVDVAEDGEKGAFLAKSNDYDGIILDNLLPKKTGLEVCRELREAGKQTPVIILSVTSESATKVELLNAGADDYMSKPFSFDELMARLRALLRRPKAIESAVLTAGDVALDASRHVVTHRGKAIQLTRKEFMLLEYLMRNEGLVLTRGMIMEHVWDMSADPFSNTIEAHIRSLRRKLEEAGAKKIIHTVPTRGYKLVAHAQR